VGGDIDGDSINDIIIGAYASSGGHGQVLGYSGWSDIDNHYDYFFDSGIENEWIGGYLGLTDINGDSVYEVLTGGAGGDTGRVWILTTQANWQVVGDIDEQPECYATLECYPNPFNERISIKFVVKSNGLANFSIFNIAGQKVAELFDGIANANQLNALTFNASDLSSGLYFARLTTPEGVKNRKLVYLK